MLPTGQSIPRSARYCSRPRRAGSSGSPTTSRITIAYWRAWRTGSALACYGPRVGWTRRRVFDLPLDLSLSRGFRLLVQQHLPSIGYGQTRSYRQVAELVGRPAAVRAVGTACATNPLPVVVPCHRVLRGDGTPGGYVGGPGAKATLLRLEAA